MNTLTPREMPTDIYKRASLGLDDDERIVFPDQYVNSIHLYDKISGVAYLVRQLGPAAEIDWVWESGLARLLEMGEVEILAKVYIVRLRLPWNEVDHEWLVSKDELDADRQNLHIIDVYLRVLDKKHPQRGEIMVDPIEFETNRERYEVVSTRYLVTWNDLEPLEIDGSRIETYMSC